ncbi:nucleoside phosphorylase [Saccharopolyspora lacisalsi]|uniref:Nucleoside phosphorylase n=1 Tax=Halosaccharopolyspora lacisalsi TaxID=1000566 RepID=A0A839DS36_9PSEU|nr:5'-methylthioadenosine/S-adenosylhomocysteine nucleosidase [Halosaccharopolyspora lacisalsi]MBA8823770.1 nucleoside phosphorylase [Halosaccharopolyspora lacisalsi]
MTENMVVVLTALNLEYDAVRRRLLNPQLQRHERGTRFEVGSLRDTGCQVALALTSKGNHSAAVLAERAIHEFDPAAVLFVGVAGALWDATPLGDVVVATHVYAYHGGTSEDDGLKARPRAWEAEHGLSQLAAHVARTDNWTDNADSGRHHPSVRFGPIAAGEIVHNSRISSEAEWIRRHYNDALAIEMESAGVAQAGHLNGSPVAIVRGISDKADGTKNTDGDGTWQPQAADNAAAFATRLAEELITEQENSPMQPRNKPSSGDVTNIAHGSTVGIQARDVTNSTVTVGAAQPAATTTDLAAELTAVRDELARARSVGTLDSPTYEEAEAELDLADKALKENTPEGKSKSVRALKRLRGMIDEAAEVAAKVAALITAVNGLS